MSLALSTCVLLISLMKLVNRAQFLGITFLLVLFASASAALNLIQNYFLLVLLIQYSYQYILLTMVF